MKTYTLNNIQITAEEIQKLIAENPEILDVKSNEKPENETIYCFLDTCGEVATSSWTDHRADNYRRDLGNFFLREYEAKAQQVINLATARVKAYIRDNELGEKFWEGDEENYYIKSEENKIGFGIVYSLNDLPLLGFFKSRDASQQVIDNNLPDLKLIYGIK